ncbi:MAG: ribonuclease R [Verrucomicrobiota bacterium]
MSFPEDLQDNLLRLLRNPKYQPLDKNALARKLKVKSAQKKAFRLLLDRLEKQGKIVRIRKNCWVLPQQAQLVTGVIHFNHKGFGFLIPEDGSEDYFVAAENTHVALHQDLVTARIIIPSKNDPPRKDKVASNFAHRKQAQVIRIIKRRRNNIVGSLEKAGKFWLVVPDDPRFQHDIYVPKPGTEEQPRATSGDKVLVKLQQWENRHQSPEGLITERLGKSGDPKVDFISIVKKYDLPLEFNTKALAELAKYPQPEGNAPFRKTQDRADLRDLFVITIDPDDARDFDDAISVTPLNAGKAEIGIHIADVSHYVKPNSALDKEAKGRGNSVYLPGKVIPMLPEELSNGLCSLRPHVDRLAFSTFITLSPKGRILKARFTRSVIHSKHRLSYQQAYTRLKRKPKDELDHFLQQAWKLASQLRKNRFSAGSLDLDMPEVKVYCNARGEVTQLLKVEHDISHQLIEEFMLLANEAVAAELKRKTQPALYRVHENPDPAKLEDYREQLAVAGIKVGDLTNRKEIQKALKQVEELPEAHSLKVGLLKSLKRAEYRALPLGHYGLAKTNYTHFTSPIRRYADLIVHRALDRLVYQRKTRSFDMKDLKAIGEHLCITERNAAEAEQELSKIKKLQFFAKQLDKKEKDKFRAIVMEVMNFGLFVELPDFVMSGLIHVSSLRHDFYDYDSRNRSLRGRRKTHDFSAGQEIFVQVERVDLYKQQLDFRLAASVK